MVSDPNIFHFKVRVKINTKMVMVRPSVLFKVRSKADFLAARRHVPYHSMVINGGVYTHFQRHPWAMDGGLGMGIQ